MSSLRLLALGFFVSAVAIVSGCSKSNDNTAVPTTESSSSSSGSSLRIAVIPKGTTHSYWKSVRAGAEAAAKEENVEMDWQGPAKEDDRAAQIAMVQQFVTEGINGIVLAPLDYDGLADPVAEASAKGIPVVIIDSALRGTVGKDYASFVATNNHDAGALGGETLAKLLNDTGKVVLLRYAPGSASTDAREAGFLEVMAKYPNITVISEDQYGGATEGESKTVALNMLDKLQQADGIFCPNESSTLGMLGALQQAQLSGKVKFVGFDGTPAEVDALKTKDIDALIAQDPRKMGYMGVKTLVKAVRKEQVPTNIDTGTAVITLDNLNDPDIQKVLGQ
jgi:ribose transport system substrate-binding protein